MRLIEADAVYKILESCEIKKDTYGSLLNDWDHGYNCGIERAESEIECAPTVEAEPKWIPVSERLPEPLETVLVTFTWKGGRYVTTDRYRYMSTFKNPIYWLDTSQYMDTQKVIAWMPLPKPYEVKHEAD